MVADFCEVLENKQCIDALAQVTPSLIAVASSSLHGSNWGGSIHLVKPGEGILHSRAVPCGVPDLCAAGGRGLLVAAEDSGDIAVYSVGEDLPLELAPASVLAEHHDIVSCVCSCTSSPAKIVSGSWDTSIKLWDIGGGEESIASLTTLWDPLGDSAGVVVDACWESTGGTADVVACCFRGKMLKLWDTREAAKKGTAQEISLPSVPCCVTWAQHSIAIGCEDGSVALIDSRAPAEPWTVTKDGLQLATGSDYGCMAVQGGDKYSSILTKKEQLHSDYVRALLWNEEGTAVVSGGWDSTIKLTEI